MSHVADVDLKITDLDACEAACDALGLELVRGAKSYKWYGQWVNDYNDSERAAAMKGHDPRLFGQCVHKIRVKGAHSDTYEVGLVPRLDGGPGFDAVYDNWQGGYGLERVAGDGLAKLKQEYGAQVATRHLMSMGYQISRYFDEATRRTVVAGYR